MKGDLSTSTLGDKIVYRTLRLFAGSGGEFERAEQYFNTAIDYCRRNGMSPYLAPAQQPDPLSRAHVKWKSR